jgi:Spy/CpxP family protein refolding chaperone
MRTLIAVVTVAVVMGVPAKLSAQGEGRGQGARLQDLQLTDKQEAQIADIIKECRPKVEEAVKELATTVREEMTKVRAVLTPEQKEKLKTLREERRERPAAGLAQRIAHFREMDLTGAEMAKVAEIRKEFRPKIRKVLEGLRGLLSDEQKKAREEGLKAGKKRREVLAALNLTDDQKAKVEAVGKELGTLVREEMEHIRDVLNEGQKAKLQEFKEERREHVRDRRAHRIANLKELNLTDEQKAELMKIRKEYRPKVHEAGNKLRTVVREEVEKVIAVLKG